MISIERRHDGLGVGSRLVTAIENDLRSEGVRVFQVKTVGESFEDEGYAATRAFYRSRGFVPLEEIHNIGWDGPTLILVKVLG